MPTVNDIINIGFSLQQDGKLDEAENAYIEALKLGSENAEVFNLMGVLKLQQNDVPQALEWVTKALEVHPCEYFYETYFQTCIRGRMYQNIADCESTIMKTYPKSFSLLFNLALAFKNLKQNKKAIEYYDKALKIDPASFQAWFNLAHLYSVESECKNAVSALKICKKLKPKDEDTEYFLSIALMRIKDYKNGLKYFENRLCKKTAVALQEKTYPHLASSDKLWKGENIKNKSIFVYFEAGFGDVIMFSRYLPLLKKKCKKLIFYPQKPLVPLFETSGLGIDELIEGYIPESHLDFDVHAPLLSLPYLLGLKGERVFAYPEGYLAANEKLKEEYREKYFNNDKFKHFYSFQTFEGSEETKKLTEKYSNVTDIGSELIDFGQTAAALSNLDLVICNDTSLAHLAGALGIPCLVMLPWEVDWRWHDNLNKCDWYDSIKLYRQKTNGDWNGVIEEIKEELEKLLT